MADPRDVVIIGGGFAGLSAGAALAAQGYRVAVLERKPALGGRAYSFVDPETGDFVDNGQHVLMGCYRETFTFLERIGASKHLVFHDNLNIEMLNRKGLAARLHTARLPGPFHMGFALLRYGHLSMGERLRLAMASLRLLRMRRTEPLRLRHLTVAELMDVLRQDERARRCFWYPLAIATLNEQPVLASAALLAEVLKRAFFSRRSDSAFVYSRVGLSELYCDGACELIQRAGGVVATHSAVEGLDVDAEGRVRAATLRGGGRLEGASFIAAVPPGPLLRLLPETVAADPFFARLGKIASSPIICVHVWLDRKVTDVPFVGFIGTTTQWMFNKGRIFEERSERYPGYLSFVISGARELSERSSEELLDIVLGDLRMMIVEARQARLVKALVLKEKLATVSAAPQSDALRPPVATPLKNFFLAGDWIQTGIPATIESAVVSGHEAASAVAAQAGGGASWRQQSGARHWRKWQLKRRSLRARTAL